MHILKGNANSHFATVMKTRIKYVLFAAELLTFSELNITKTHTYT